VRESGTYLVREDERKAELVGRSDLGVSTGETAGGLGNGTTEKEHD
jgi:hypothetical protein